MSSAQQYSFLHCESHVFIDDFLFTSFQQKNEIKKGKYLNEIQIFTFLCKQMNDLFDTKDDDWHMLIWLENVFKGNLILDMVGEILLGKGFLLVNTWLAPVWKQLKWLTISFAHTFITRCQIKMCLLFYEYFLLQ